MGIEKYNKSKVYWSIDTTGFKYVKLSDLKQGEHYPLCGMFISPDSGYGEGAVLITDKEYVNIPERNIEVIRAMMSDEEVIADINAGKCEFSYGTFESKKYHRQGFAVTFHSK